MTRKAGDDDSWYTDDPEAIQGFGTITQLTDHASRRVDKKEPIGFKVTKKRGTSHERLRTAELPAGGHRRSVGDPGGGCGLPAEPPDTMTRFKVYLAGAISGLAHDDAQDWRAYVREALAPKGIDAYSPLRQKQFLRLNGVIDSTREYLGTPLATDKGIMTRDHFDCQSSDLIFVNLLGTTRVSIGTVMEIAWAFAYRKPLVMAMEATGNLHEHPMIREAIGYRVPTLDHAIAVTQAILLPHTEEN